MADGNELFNMNSDEGTVTGMDNQTALAVQSLIASQTVENIDDDDLFQCGKCKKQFTSLPGFVTHKQSRCVPMLSLPDTQTADSDVDPEVDDDLSLNDVKTKMTSDIDDTNNEDDTITSEPSIASEFNSSVESIKSQTVDSFCTISAPTYPSTINNGVVLNDELMSFSSLEHPISSTLQLSALSESSPMLSQVEPLTPVNQSTNSTQISEVTLQQLQGQQILLLPSTQADGSNKSVIMQQLTTKSGKTTQNKDKEVVVQNITLPMKGGVMEAMAAGKVKKSPEMMENGNSSKKKTLTCRFCQKVFLKNFDLQQHIRSHTGEKPFQCVVCGRAFAQKSNVKKHMQTHKVWPSGTGKTLASDPFVSGRPAPPVVDQSAAMNLEDNIQVSEKGDVSGTIQVPLVQYKSAKVEGAVELNMNPTIDTASEKIKETILVDNSYICQYCGLKHKSYPLLKSHMLIHKEEQVYKCILRTCGRTFPELESFLEHTKAHENEMIYRCHLCNKNFATLHELGIHQYSHSLYPGSGTKNTKYFRCLQCNNKYVTPEALAHHSATTDHTFPCIKCDRVFSCERYLRKHLALHGTEFEFICIVCSKGFKTPHYLKAHMAIHSSDKPFTCLMCSAAFNRKDRLQRHMLIHNPVKQFKCPFKAHTGCTKEFNRQDKLKAHIICHSGLKLHTCDQCGRSFSRPAHLRNHKKIHNNDYKYRCEVCSKGFTREKLLDEHRCPGEPVEAALVHRGRKSKRKVGRPRKRMISTEDCSIVEKRARGRPRKTSTPVPTEPESNDVEHNNESISDLNTAKEDVNEEVHIQIMSQGNPPEATDDQDRFITIQQCDIEAAANAIYSANQTITQDETQTLVTSGPQTATLVVNNGQVLTSGQNTYLASTINGTTQYLELVAAENPDGTTHLSLQNGQQIFTAIPATAVQADYTEATPNEHALAVTEANYFDANLV